MKKVTETQFNKVIFLVKRLGKGLYKDMQSMPITSVRRSWPMQIVKGSLYAMIELLKMTDVS